MLVSYSFGLTVMRLALLCASLLLSLSAHAQVRVAQLSDIHIGEKHSPHALENLRRAVDMINRRHPDAVIVSGDIGENPTDWELARNVLRGIKAPMYIVPGNHDVHTEDVERYRRVFGRDYYRFEVKGVTFVAIDSQLLGNFEHFDAHNAPPMPAQTTDQSNKMLAWLDDLPREVNTGEGDRRGGDSDRDRDDARRVVIAVQHIPVFRDPRVLPDPKPYWVISEPFRSRELEDLKKLGVQHVLCGHWHRADVFEAGGITWHVAPATSWLPWGGELGFAMHTIGRDGDVRTEIVPLDAGP